MKKEIVMHIIKKNISGSLESEWFNTCSIDTIVGILAAIAGVHSYELKELKQYKEIDSLHMQTFDAIFTRRVAYRMIIDLLQAINEKFRVALPPID